MDFDTVAFLESLFGGSMSAMAITPPEPVGTVTDPLAALPYVDWAQRPDRHGRMGWETPDLPEWQRWWARCDFDDLPVVPEGFSMGTLSETTPEDLPGCVAGGMADTLDLSNNRPLQGQLRGFVGV
jgi:hypothetical protein